MRDVRRVEAWRKISFSFSLHAHWQICTKRRHFSFLFLGSIVLLSVIYIYIYTYTAKNLLYASVA
jgi:hypothetical protein